MMMMTGEKSVQAATDCWVIFSRRGEKICWVSGLMDDDDDDDNDNRVLRRQSKRVSGGSIRMKGL